MTDVQVFAAILVSLIGLGGAIGAALVGARQKGLSDLVVALGEELERHTDRIDDLERRDRAQADYILALREHIIEGNPPPPPAWPQALL